MANIVWSKKAHSFFDKSVSAVIPDDSVDVPASLYSQLLLDQSQGKVIASDGAGLPYSMGQQPRPVHVLLDEVKAEMRKPRAEMLDALNGIASRAQRAGNTALATEADALALQLLDITDDPELNAAATLDGMRDAAQAAYRRIAASASAELAVVFKEITGA